MTDAFYNGKRCGIGYYRDDCWFGMDHPFQINRHASTTSWSTNTRAKETFLALKATALQKPSTSKSNVIVDPTAHIIDYKTFQKSFDKAYNIWFSRNFIASILLPIVELYEPMLRNSRGSQKERRSNDMCLNRWQNSVRWAS